ncbi:hypothetical protein SAMN04488543_3055 [Friedmanniella luteola]|uniref:Uncharacterized protein n=1 Tax=Friedmanniella luteola TaxID=546871 RepID=A0A1H1XPC1_9ACTN|nr:hypothetical protein SAMN04488543_3055 [Friedmanniella luteola]
MDRRHLLNAGLRSAGPPHPSPRPVREQSNGRSGCATPRRTPRPVPPPGSSGPHPDVTGRARDRVPPVLPPLPNPPIGTCVRWRDRLPRPPSGGEQAGSAPPVAQAADVGKVARVSNQGRWQRVLLDGPCPGRLVGVAAALDRHLGRRATRVELNAARRTASRMAADGRLSVHLVRVHPGQRAGGGVFMVAARPNVEVDGHRLQEAARGRTAAASDPAGAERERQRTAHHADQAATLLKQAAEHALAMNVDQLPPDQAVQVDGRLAAALSGSGATATAPTTQRPRRQDSVKGRRRA